MSLKLNIVVGSLRPPQVNFIFLNSISLHRPWRPHRRKRSTYLVIRSNHQLSSSSYSSQDNLFHTFLSQLNSLDLLAPALGFTTTLALIYNSTRTSLLSNGIGDWTLFTSPTPFNRFVKLRCASLLLEESNEKLIKEDGHLVSFDSGPIPQTIVNDYTEQISYQRICVNTDDGGVVSLDWPANLDLANEHGLDTTILVIPGTTDGSMDENVRSFVYECLKRGCFPIVMNPRGCARSPLTTPRLFTAGDSDDICTAVQFVNRARPWTTLMGVGFGYGANMLTKYLAEVGEDTPLTSATCLDNPFDLKVATKSPDHLYVNQNLTDGLTNMLKSNKELFQGRSKGFDVEMALQAKSLRDFEEAISMVSYGFDSIEEFYVNSSTKDVVNNIKIPLLFIQQNDAVSSFSIPRGLIAQNPYTSLLTCTFQSNDKINSGTYTVSWCQHLVVEWLTAVELGLLKGRHPLLEDTDVTINPSRPLKLMSSKGSITNNVHQLDDLKKMVKRNEVYSSSGLELQRFEEKEKDIKKITNGTVTQENLLEVVNEDVADSERGKMLQATEVVMNMLDVTMPEVLSQEQKQKVLTAIGQGETLMNALQGAVPEDVRGKLTGAVTGILENQKKVLNGLSSISKIPDTATSALNTKTPEKEPNTTSEHSKVGTGLPEDSNKNEASRSVKEPEAHGNQSQSTTHESVNKDTGLPEDSNKNEASRSVKEPEAHENQSQSTIHEDGNNILKEKTAQSSHLDELDTSGATDKSKKVESSGTSEDQVNEKVKVGHEETKDKDVQQKEETNPQIPNDQKSPVSEESSSPSVVIEDGENHKKEEPSVPPVPTTSTSNSPSFGVSQALDALTGMDDSTQVAVNSVFSVIEDVITQLEGNKEDDDSAIDDKNKVEDLQDGKSNIETEKKDEIQNSITKIPYKKPLYDQHVRTHLLSNMKNNKFLDPDAANALPLNYVPEQGQWKLPEQSGDGSNHIDNDDDDVIEPAYVILDSESDTEEETDDGTMVLMQHVKKNILNSLKVEVCRRIEATDMEDIAPTLKKELEHVANVISLAVVNEKEYIISWDGEDLFGPGNPHAERILDAITSAVEGTKYMKKVIPAGIVVGSSLASLKKVFNISTPDSVGTNEVGRDELQADRMVANKVNRGEKVNDDDEYEYDEEDHVSSSVTSDSVMVGAVTAAIGASALLVHQQDSYGDGVENLGNSMSLNQKEESGKLDEDKSKDSDEHNNIVTSLAEKAMLVAGPVVPTTEGGEVDQERLVAMLADLGQRGGILRLVGKLALLWGGIRGAMSLIGKLISFLRLSERPLFQRILGFVSLVLVLWTPVVVPLLPTLVQNWASHNSSTFAELACIIGLYSSIMVLVVLWGKRIRGYQDPLEKYGLKLTSPSQIKSLLSGLIGGVVLVSLIQFTNMSLGFVSVSWSTTTLFPSDAVTLLKISGQGLITATTIALVEELLFRSWLTEEITVDLGFHPGIILSGLAFSISQWSLKAIPGLWLLSLGLAGVRQKSQGSLSLPIGLRAGIMASSFILKEGGFLIIRPNYPSWVITGGDAFQPFNSVVGLVFALLWAVILYPKKPNKDNIYEETQE